MASETFKKRQKELARKEKQQQKAARRMERRSEKARTESQVQGEIPTHQSLLFNAARRFCENWICHRFPDPLLICRHDRSLIDLSTRTPGPGRGHLLRIPPHWLARGAPQP